MTLEVKSTGQFYLGYVNSVLNPLIYAFVNDEFQRSLRRAIRDLGARRNNMQVTFDIIDYNSYSL